MKSCCHGNLKSSNILWVKITLLFYFRGNNGFCKKLFFLDSIIQIAFSLNTDIYWKLKGASLTRPLQVDYRLGSWPENPIIFYFMFKLTEFYRQKSLNIAFSIAQDPIQAQNSFKQTNKDRNKTTKCFVQVKAKLRRS